MSKFFDINSQPSLHITSHKNRLEYLDKEIINTFQIKKKGKKLFSRE